MTVRKGFDGRFPVLHVVTPGESLSSIALAYRFPSWEPIVRYNRDVLGRAEFLDPDLILAGARLMIPRSPAGYRRWIGGLDVLKAEVWSTEVRLAAEIDALENQHHAENVLWDLGGDVATTLVTALTKGVLAANKAYTAHKTASATKRADVDGWTNGLHHAEKAFGEAADMAVGWRRALDASFQARKIDALDTLRDTVSGTSLATGLETLLGPDASRTVMLARKLHRARARATGGSLKKLAEVTGDGATRGSRSKKWAGDSADAILEYLGYLSPSAFANAWIAWSAGESVAELADRFADGQRESLVIEGMSAQRHAIRSSARRQEAALSRKIREAKREWRAVWGNTIVA